MGNDPMFTRETFRFFRELGGNNRKAWMDENRDRYRAAIVVPFRSLLEELTPAIRKLDRGFEVGGRTGENFSRINRDIRFAADKSPYRTQMYLKFSRQAASAGGDGQLYVGVSAEGVTAGFRSYFESRESTLARIGIPRAKQNGKWIERQEKRLGNRYDSYWYSSEKGDWIKHPGWPAKPEDWKKLKGWIVRRKFGPTTLLRPGFASEVGKIFREVYPLYRFTSSADWKP